MAKAGPQPTLSATGALRTLWRALSFLEGERRMVAVVVTLALGGAALAALEPLVLKRIFDGLQRAEGSQALVRGVLLLIAVALGRDLITTLQNYLTWRTRIRVQFALVSSTISRLHRLPLSFHRQEGVGALMTRIDRGVQGFVGAIHEVCFTVVPSAVYLVMAITVMLRLDWRLGLAVAAFVPIPAVIAAAAAPMQARRERNLLDRWVAIYQRFNEVLSGIVTVKSFAMEEREKQRFLQDTVEANRVVVRGVKQDSLITFSQSTVITIARLVAIAFGGVLILRGAESVGTLVAFLGYVGGVFAPAQALSGTYRTLRTAQVSMGEVFSILDATDSLGDSPDSRDLEKVDGAIRFEDIHFRYPGPNRPLLNGITLDVKPGENIALVGPSGAGKTTLMSLLCRFYDPVQGRVLIDGVDIRAYKQASLRKHIGVVLQDSLLFNESVRNNIAYGRPEASFEEIVAAAKAAHAHDFIEALPERYDTIVGERGSRLSAGERQRIAIARSILKDPRILILDEPTSALDAESEAMVQEALNRLMKGRTSFAIAHRLATVVGADRILVLKDGQILEEGSHRELMQRNGYYASLVRRQVEGLLLPDDLPPDGAGAAH